MHTHVAVGYNVQIAVDAKHKLIVEQQVTNQVVDIGLPLHARLGQFIAPDLVVVPLTLPFPFVVVGSPDYLRQRRKPERIDDLRDHACLRMRRSNGSIAP